MKVAVVIFNDSRTHIYGVVTIDKKYVTMYDARDAVRKWFAENFVTAYDFRFSDGQVFFTAGNATPYQSSMWYKTTDSLLELI